MAQRPLVLTAAGSRAGRWALAQIELPFADPEPAPAPIDAHRATFRHVEIDTTATTQRLAPNSVVQVSDAQDAGLGFIDPP